MGDHGIAVHRAEFGRHRADAAGDPRPQPSDLMDLLATLQSTLTDATRAGDRAGMRAAVAGRVACWMALADLADDVHPAYSLACRRLAAVERESLPGVSGDGRPGATASGRHASGRHAAEHHAAEHHAAERYTVAGRHGRHSAVEAGDRPGRAGRDSRRLSVAALLERALAHETPISVLVAAEAAAARRAAGAVEERQSVERWTGPGWSEPEGIPSWMPVQRREESEPPRPSEPGDAEVVRPVGWHPVPRPRHSAEDRPGGPAGPETPHKLAG